jgi:hypothetical protein
MTKINSKINTCLSKNTKIKRKRRNSKTSFSNKRRKRAILNKSVQFLHDTNTCENELTINSTNMLNNTNEISAYKLDILCLVATWNICTLIDIE